MPDTDPVIQDFNEREYWDERGEVEGDPCERCPGYPEGCRTCRVIGRRK